MSCRIFLSIFVWFSLFGLAGEEPEWDVNKPFGETIPVNFTTDEGTWICLDVSPDGSEIVFDLLGDVYIMPITGGKAKRLLGDASMDIQPRFSPNGKYISFTSDRDGGDNIWYIKRDGTELRQVTKESFRLLNNAVWTPDSQYLIARKHFTSQRSIGAGEMWMYHISGGGGLQLTKMKNDQQDAGEPCISPDGRYLWFSEDMSPGPTFQYNKDANGQIYVVRQLDRETGELKNLITGNGGAGRPQVSPDGKTIAFVRRVRAKTVLHLYDRESGLQRALYDGLDHDQQEAWAVFGTYPGFDWTPDGKSIVIWAGGKIKRVDAESGKAADIPFQVQVDKQVMKSPRFKQDLQQSTLQAAMIRNPALSPDGKTLVFHALGHLWRKTLPDGEPKRLTQEDGFEYQPAFSPDGKSLVYTSWSDEELGAVRVVPAKGGPSQKLTEKPGYYHSASFSPDGSKIVYRRGSGSRSLGYIHGLHTGIYIMNSDGSGSKLVTENGRNPRFNAEGDRIYIFTGFGLSKQYRSVDLTGSDERTHFNLKYVTDVVPSPDNKWVAFREGFNAYVAPMPKTGKPFDLNSKTKSIPVKKISEDSGNYLHWSQDGEQLGWMMGNHYHARSIKDSFSFMEGAPDPLPPTDAPGLAIDLTYKPYTPEGIIAFKGARLATMKGDQVIENGSIVIEGNRITAIGTSDEVTIPKNAKIIDAKGKTIMPGIIDVHAHAGHFFSGPIPEQYWPYYVNLAYGVTTAHDPSANTETVFSMSELVKAGAMVGPRVFSTGSILYGADGDIRVVINSEDDALAHLKRLKSVGAFSVKSYNQPRRNQKQQILAAAHKENMLVVNEGGSTFIHNISMILDGTTGIEHNLPVAPLYKDVLDLMAASEVGYTPTLVVSFGGVSGEYYWYQHSEVWAQKRLLTFMPRSSVDARSRRRQMLPENEYYYQEVSRSAKALNDRGVSVQIGAHGQLQGLAAHWEIWMLEQGGMSPMQALQAATINGARYLGLDHDIGSLEPGKLADLIVLDSNPLENIRASETVNMVMVGGRLFDAHTMNEIGNQPKKRDPFWWERDGDGTNFGSDFTTGSGCSCGRQ